VYKYPECGDGGDTSFDDYLKSPEVDAIMAKPCIGLRAETRRKMAEERKEKHARSKVQSQYQVQLQGL